jgi:hypothetical protein
MKIGAYDLESGQEDLDMEDQESDELRDSASDSSEHSGGSESTEDSSSVPENWWESENS